MLWSSAVIASILSLLLSLSSGYDQLQLLPINFTFPTENFPKSSTWYHYLFRNVSKRIPRILWVASKEIPTEKSMTAHLRRIISKAKSESWVVHFMDDAAIDSFMTTYFSNTSILWAYQSVHPGAKIAGVDIWRYAALYTFGGFYMDDDADMLTSIEQIVTPEDVMILSTETNPYENECYIDSYKLSDVFLEKKYQTSQFKNYFGGKFLINWAMFAAPGHPLMLEVLSNIVDVFRHQHTKASVLKKSTNNQNSRSRVVICATGPGILTATVRKVMLEHEQLQDKRIIAHIRGDIPKIPYALTDFRLSKKPDFKDYGGRFKAKSFKDHIKTIKNYTYYLDYMQQNNVPIIREDM